VSAISDRIKAADDLTEETVIVPEWDVTVVVKSMTGKARAMLFKRAAQPDGTMDFEALYPAILIGCCFDPESGEPVFTDADAEWLNDKSAGPVERLAQVGMQLSGLQKDAVDAGKAVSS
jgi:hypothetical protein